MVPNPRDKTLHSFYTKLLASIILPIDSSTNKRNENPLLWCDKCANTLSILRYLFVICQWAI